MRATVSRASRIAFSCVSNSVVRPRRGGMRRVARLAGTGRQVRHAMTMASLRPDTKAGRVLDKTQSKVAHWATKLPQQGRFADLLADDATRADAEGVSRRWHAFDQADVSGLHVSMLGGNVTIVTKSGAHGDGDGDGKVWVYNIGQDHLMPAVQLEGDGVLNVEHQQGVTSYIGQNEPVHTVIVLSDTLDGDVDVSLKVGEVWVMGPGIEDTGGPFEGHILSRGACNVTCGLGDVTLIDSLAPSTAVTAHVGDFRLLLRPTFHLGDTVADLNVTLSMGDVKAMVHASHPLAQVKWGGKDVEPMRPADTSDEAAVDVQDPTPTSAINLTGRTSMIGDCRLVRFA